MRSLSWVVLVLVLILSWKFRQPETSFSVVENSRIQKGMKEFISDYIKTQVGDKTEIKFHTLWSEPLLESKKEDQYRVHFSYSFKKEDDLNPAIVTVTGNCILTKEESSETPKTLVDSQPTSSQPENLDGNPNENPSESLNAQAGIESVDPSNPATANEGTPQDANNDLANESEETSAESEESVATKSSEPEENWALTEIVIVNEAIEYLNGSQVE
jgi:hypothetical protein